MPGDKPPLHPSSTPASSVKGGVDSSSVRSSVAGGSVTRRRATELARISLARISATAQDIVREVIEPPTQPEPVGAEAAEIVPLKVAEEGAAAGKRREEGEEPKIVVEPSEGLSTLTHDADEDGVRRRGTVFSGVMHVITAVIGAGVLTLPSAMAALGYVGGTVTVVLAGLVTLYTAQLLADLYIINGKRQRTYTQMVLTCFGRRGEIAIGVIQLGNLALTAIAYMVTAAKTMRTLAHAGCGLPPAEAAEAGDVKSCFDTYWIFVLIFGALQLVLSQVPSLENLAFMSVVGAVASFGYAFIAFVLSSSHVPKPPLGSLWGQPLSVWKDLNAVGNILFAFSFSFMLIEIQDTMRSEGDGRGPVRPMKRAVNIALAIMGAFYLAVALSGYAAFGDTAKNPLGVILPDDILTGFPGPRWAIFLANILVLIHMIPAFQVWSQPLFECVELAVEHRIEKRRDGKWPAGLCERRFRLIFRTLYVIVCTFLALMLPFMGVILGLAGALGFWPATVVFPIESYIKVFKPRAGMRHALRLLSVACAIISVVCVIASVKELATEAKDFKLFSA